MVTRVGVVAAELEEKWIDKERVLDPERKGLVDYLQEWV